MKKFISVLLLSLLVLSLITGCASKPSQDAAQSTETSAAATAAAEPAATPAEKVKITLVSSKVETQTQLQTIVDTYNKLQQSAEIELLGTSGDNYATVLQSQFAASPEKAPTIFSMSGIDVPKFQQFMAPLDGTKAASLMADIAKADVTVDGKIMGLPSAVEGYGLIYNKTMFKEAGVDAAAITSIDALVEASKKLATVKGVEKPIAFAKENYFIFIHPFNTGFAITPDYAAQIEKVNKGEITLKDIPAVKQYAADLDKLAPYTNKALNTYDEQVTGFAAGKYAMIHQGNWAQGMLNDNKVTFEYGMMPLPTSGNTSISVGPANAWRVNNKATPEQQKAATDFLDWLITSDQGQDLVANTLKFISPYKGVKTSADPLAQDVAAYVTSGKTIPWVYNTYFPNGIDVGGAAAMQEYYAGKINSTQLLDKINAEWMKGVKK